MLNFLPCVNGRKNPAVSTWQKYQREHYNGSIGDERGIVCGKISDGLEVLDFDKAGICFDPFIRSLASSRLDLVASFVIERTPSGGYHIYFYSDLADKNQKLARDSAGDVLIETRGEGGFVKCAPSYGYTLTQGDFNNIPRLTAEDRETLLALARSFNEYKAKEESIVKIDPSTPPKNYNGAFTADSLRDPCYRSYVVELLQSIGFIELPGRDGNRLRFGHRDASNPNDVKGELYEDNLFYTFATSNIGRLDPDTQYTPLNLASKILHGDTTSESKKKAFIDISKRFGYWQDEPPRSGDPIEGANEREGNIVTDKERQAKPITELPLAFTDPEPLPESIISSLPSILTSLAEHVDIYAARPQRGLTVVAFLSVLAHFLNGRAIVKGRITRPHIKYNTILIAEPGSGKEYIKSYLTSLIEQAIEAWRNNKSVSGDFNAFEETEVEEDENEESFDIVLNSIPSSQYLKEILAQTNGEAIFIQDEAADYFTGRGRDSVKVAFMQFFKEILEAPYFTRTVLNQGIGQSRRFKDGRLRTSSDKTNVNAVLLTQKRFLDTMTTTDLGDGLFSRFYSTFGSDRKDIIKYGSDVVNDYTPRESDIILLTNILASSLIEFKKTFSEDGFIAYEVELNTNDSDATARISRGLLPLSILLAFLRYVSETPRELYNVAFTESIEVKDEDLDLANRLLAYHKAGARYVESLTLSESMSVVSKQNNKLSNLIIKSLAKYWKKNPVVPSLRELLFKYNLLSVGSLKDIDAAMVDLKRAGLIDYKQDAEHNIIEIKKS